MTTRILRVEQNELWEVVMYGGERGRVELSSFGRYEDKEGLLAKVIEFINMANVKPHITKKDECTYKMEY